MSLLGAVPLDLWLLGGRGRQLVEQDRISVDNGVPKAFRSDMFCPQRPVGLVIRGLGLAGDGCQQQRVVLHLLVQGLARPAWVG